jgi:hypothetical protein
MYLPPVTIAYSQKAPITRQMAAMIERITQKITLWGLAAMLRPSVDGPQPDAGPLPLSVASAMPNAMVAGINGEPGHSTADQLPDHRLVVLHLPPVVFDVLSSTLAPVRKMRRPNRLR